MNRSQLHRQAPWVAPGIGAVVAFILSGVAVGQGRGEFHEGGLVIQVQARPPELPQRELPKPVLFEQEKLVETAIGDPWWDEAASPPPVSGEPPLPEGDPKALAQQLTRARLATVRRSRGLQALRRELSLIRSANPTLEPAARGQIVAVGRKVVEAQAAGITPLENGIEHPLKRALSTEAGADAAAAYDAQLAARAARRQATTIAVLVEAIDREALLDADQQAALTDVLKTKWRPDWGGVLKTALRQQITTSQLPAGVTDAAADILDLDTFMAWRKRAGKAKP